MIKVISAFLVICILSFLPSYAQRDPVMVSKKDDSNIVPVYPDDKHLEEFRNDRDYNYSEDPQPPENPLNRWLNELFAKFGKLFSIKSYESFWQYALLALVSALALFFLYKAKVLDYLFPSKSIQESNDYVVGQENIHEINFEESIANALSQGDYRLAIRLQYLKILKLLTTRELIHWKPNLTNQSYAQELQKHPFHDDFVALTKYFEFAWYGDFQVNESGFQEMKDFYNSFQEKIAD